MGKIACLRIVESLYCPVVFDHATSSFIELIMSSDVKAHLRITGRVQGVGYRYFTLEKAKQLRLRGYTRNLWNGDVEAIVEGPRNLIERLIQYLQQGPTLARVDDIDITWEEANGEFSHFDIRR